MKSHQVQVEEVKFQVPEFSIQTKASKAIKGGQQGKKFCLPCAGFEQKHGKELVKNKVVLNRYLTNKKE